MDYTCIRNMTTQFDRFGENIMECTNIESDMMEKLNDISNEYEEEDGCKKIFHIEHNNRKYLCKLLSLIPHKLQSGKILIFTYNVKSKRELVRSLKNENFKIEPYIMEEKKELESDWWQCQDFVIIDAKEFKECILDEFRLNELVFAFDLLVVFEWNQFPLNMKMSLSQQAYSDAHFLLTMSSRN